MQSVSDDKLAIALAKCGGLSLFITLPIDEQAEMVRRVKKYKSGLLSAILI